MCCSSIGPLTLTHALQRRGDKTARMIWKCVLGTLLLFASALASEAAPPAPPASVKATNHPWDEGEQIDVTIELSPDDVPPKTDNDAEPKKAVARYVIQRSSEPNGKFEDVASAELREDDYEDGFITVTVGKNHREEPYFFRAGGFFRR